MLTEAETVTQKLSQSYNVLNKMLLSVAKDQDWSRDAYRWSFRYTAAHIMTLEADCFLPRAMQIAGGINPRFDFYINANWSFDHLDIEQSLELWRRSRSMLINFVRNLPVSSLEQKGTHMTRGDINVIELLELLYEHDKRHINALRETLAVYHNMV